MSNWGDVRDPTWFLGPVIDINSALFGFTPTNLGVTLAREVNPFTDVCCFVVARATNPPASPARAVRPERQLLRGCPQGDLRCVGS